jgi:lipoate-protein ligase A
MPTLRVIYDVDAAGDWNMAVDEALAESVGQGGPATLRFYGWSPATLSLGYFQRIADRAFHSASGDCAVVRRASGGGAILHDQELTYSLVVPADLPDARDAQTLYWMAHSVLRETLAKFGVAVTLREAAIAAVDPPFLCFQRGAVGDVLLDGQKIAGSAQRRHWLAVVQHGSILLRTSKFAPELPGIEELSGVQLLPGELASALAAPLSERLGHTPLVGGLQDAERASAERIRGSKFGDHRWITKR